MRLVAISASELRPDHTYLSNLDEFKRRIASIGLGDVEILPTLLRLDLSFIGYCVLGGRWSSAL